MQFVREIFCKAEGEVAFADGLGANLTGKVVETTKEVAMYMLQTLNGSDFYIVYQTAF